MTIAWFYGQEKCESCHFAACPIVYRRTGSDLCKQTHGTKKWGGFGMITNNVEMKISVHEVAISLSFAQTPLYTMHSKVRQGKKKCVTIWCQDPTAP
jgi:hypothetical protein